jgi:ribosomal protein S12 methylthiotransferase accessory factor
MSDPSSGLHRFLDVAAKYLIDGQVGIIRSVTPVVHEAGAPGLFEFSAQARALDGNAIRSGGASTSRAMALAKTIGEAVERYCASICDRRELRLSTWNDADFPCVTPPELAIYNPSQLAQAGFPLAAFAPDTRVAWVSARDLTADQPCFVPAAKVFVPYRPDTAAGEPLLFQSITTGLACHTSFESAAVGAICEVLERDAFMIMWQARLAMPSIRVDSLDHRSRDLLERYTRAGGEVRVFNLTLDHGVPTVCVTLRSTAPGVPALVFSAATELDPQLAVWKCLEELELMRGFAGWIMGTQRPLLGEADEVITREDHVNFYCDAARAKHADFLFSSGAEQHIDDIESLATGRSELDLQILIRRLSALGHRVLLKDLTTIDIAPLGLTVVRAIVPGFQPLVFGHRLRALGGSRLWTVPQRLGYSGITPATGDNTAPHPFP